MLHRHKKIYVHTRSLKNCFFGQFGEWEAKKINHSTVITENERETGCGRPCPTDLLGNTSLPALRVILGV
jgi:hypothetical protein